MLLWLEMAHTSKAPDRNQVACVASDKFRACRQRKYRVLRIEVVNIYGAIARDIISAATRPSAVWELLYFIMPSRLLLSVPSAVEVDSELHVLSHSR